MSARLIAVGLLVCAAIVGVKAWESHLIGKGDARGAARVQADWDTQENARNAATARDNATKFRNAERIAHEDAKRESARLARDAAAASVVRGLRDEITRLNQRPNPYPAGDTGIAACTREASTYDMDTLINEITNAVLFGYQPLELVWGPFNGAAAPLQVIGKPQEWFFFDNAAQLRFRSRQQPLQGEELEPRKFLLARQEASYDNPYGFADLSMCFWADTFMRGGLKFWVTFTEKYGTPWLVGKQPRGTPGSEVNNLLDKLEAMVQDAVAAIPDDSSIDILESGDKGASADLYERLLMYCRSEINIALLGQNQSTESNSNRASATAGLEVAKTIRDGDAALVMATMNQLLRWLTDLHDGEQAPAPIFVLFEEEDVNTQQAVRDETLTKAGLKFTKEYWKRVYRLQDGDIEEAPAGPSMPKAPGAAAAVPVEFVEGSAPAVMPTGELNTAAAPIVMAWVRDLRALVEAHSEPQALQDALLEAYSELPTDELTEVMALAFELAHLQGRDQVMQGAGRG